MGPPRATAARKRFAALRLLQPVPLRPTHWMLLVGWGPRPGRILREGFMAIPFWDEAEECLTEARELWRGEAGGPDFDIWRYEAWEGDLPRPDSR